MAKKTQLTYKEIEDRLRCLKDSNVSKDEIGYKILYGFGKSERELDRYREGKGVIKTFDGLLIKGLFCYRSSSTLRFADDLDDLKLDHQVLKAAPKIIAVSDGITIRAFDLRQRQTFEQRVDRLYCDFEFFYPLAGVERIEYVEESPADIKAAEKLAKLHDEIRAYNEFTSDSDLYDLNNFIARLLFCFFAEDTGIFADNVFTNAIKIFTIDGRNLKAVLEQIFRFMGNKPIPAGIIQTYCKQHFAFVGGGLFERNTYIPELSFKARQIIIESGELDWQNINPDIFGSMIQAVVNPDVRATQGLHYTSVPNIMKVINPLFLDDLRAQYQSIAEEFDKVQKQKDMGVISQDKFYALCRPIDKKCNQLMRRMSKMKFFDPACGSGNFLIITYKMLRLLEMDILTIKKKCSRQSIIEFIDDSCISLQQFYGIELFDFPHEIAMLSLWLAEHQMNKKMHEDFGVNKHALPLQNINNIRCGNACRVDWNEVCPHTKEEEVYIFGNPPYLGSRNQDESQKTDLDIVFNHSQSYSGYRKLDYISCWFLKAKQFISDSPRIRCAFVSTNSITQGEQLSIFWTPLLDVIEIGFAYTTFKWKNNAKNNAGVSVVIICIQFPNKNSKILYSGEKQETCDFISPSLSSSKDYIVEKSTKPISGFPEMRRGNMPNDKEFLRINPDERLKIISEYPNAEKFIRRQVGADEYINSIEKYCYWIKDEELQEALSIPVIKQAVDSVRDYRINSKDKTLHVQAKRPHQMREFFECGDSSLLIPIVSSESRKYIPIGFVDKYTIIPNSAQVVYDANIFIFGILTSLMHMIWVRNNAGRLENRFRYSIFLCYNTFPFPKISNSKKIEIENAATNILLIREPYLTRGKTLADLYDPDKMPDDLKEAHRKLDDIVESCYPGYPFTSDDARLECLYKMYERMTSN